MAVCSGCSLIPTGIGFLSLLPGADGRCQEAFPDFDKETPVVSQIRFVCVFLKFVLGFCFSLWWSPSSLKVGMTFSVLEPDELKFRKWRMTLVQ